MENEGSTFCVHCGRKVDAGNVYCPNCGMTTDDAPVYSEQVPYRAEAVKGTDYLRIARIMMILYAALSAFSVLILFAMYGVFPTGNPEVDQAVIDSVPNANTMDEVKNLLLLSGALSLISLVLVALSLSYVVKKSKWTPAWIFCAAASLVLVANIPSSGYANLVSVIIGLLVTYFIYASKEQFSDTGSSI